MSAAQPADLMRTLSDPTRMAIYERIASKGEATVSELTGHAGVSQPAVSQHLRVLQEANLIVGRRDGRYVFYRAQPGGLAPLADWLKQYERLWQERFDRLEAYLHDVQRNEGPRDRK